MNATATLTRRENEVAELIAWGATKKEIAKKLFLSERTIENHTRSIYEKTGVTKSNELSAWWFCHKFRISFDLSPLRRVIIAIALLMLVFVQEFVIAGKTNMILRTRKSECHCQRRKDEHNNDYLFEL